MYLVRGEKHVEGRLPTITFHERCKTHKQAREVAIKYLRENETAYTVTIIPVEM